MSSLDMNSVLFYGATIEFMVGIALTSVNLLDLVRTLLCLIIGVAFATLFLIQRERLFILCSVVAFALTLGSGWMLAAERFAVDTLSRFEGEKIELVGIVGTEPDKRANSTLVTVDIESVNDEEANGRVLVFDTRRSIVEYGDRVSVKGELRRPEAFETDLGRTFDYPGYLRARGVTHTMSFGEVRVDSHDNGWGFVSALLWFKEHMSASIERALLAPESGLALGLLLGERQSLGNETEDAFREAGLIHIVVLSGYNIALMITAAMALLAFASLRARTLAGLVVIVAFVLMVGPSATVVRAAVMASLIVVAKATGNTYAIMRALMVAGVAMLVWNPHLLVHDPGFQLSFLATLGLILLAPMLDAWLDRYSQHIPLISSVREYLVATVATQIMVAPLLVYSIGAFSIVSIASNVAVLPLVPLAMLLSAVTGAVGMLSTNIALLIGYPTDLVLAYMIRATESFANIPHASVDIPQFPFVVVLISYALLGVAIFYLSQRKSEKKKTPTKARLSSGVFPF